MKKYYLHLFAIILITVLLGSPPSYAAAIYTNNQCQYTLQDTLINPVLAERLRLSKLKFKNKKHLQNLEKSDGIVTVDGLTIEDLVKDIFIGGNCFDASGIVAPGGEGSFGEFYSGTSSISIEEGIILSTGMINIAHGPNVQTGASSSAGTAGVDPDLQDLVNSSNLNDVAIIEFDFVPNDDSISFDYVFASEEYCDYVNSQFNDVFGFFLSGPGINGPFTNNAINIAKVPQTNDFVAINEVNWTDNSSYYVDNVPIGQGQGSGGCTQAELNNPPHAPNDIEFDGFTTVLTARAEVIPCETYHIKLAIADVADGLFDSAVFLKGNSFSAGSGADVEIGYPDPRFEVAFEGCSNGYFYFERAGNSDINEPLTINFTIHSNSTATPGEDYEEFPTSFTIPAGLEGDTLWILVFEDLIIEGQETVIIELDNTCSCVNPIYELIIDEPDILDFELEDYEFCSPRSLYLSPDVTGGIPPYNFLWENGSTAEDRLVAPLVSTTYYLTVTDQCGQEKVDSSTFTIFEQLEANIEGSVQLCASNPQDTGYLIVNFLTGAGPWGIVYSIDGIPYSLFDISDNPFYLPVTQAGEYELLTIFMEDCFGQGSGISMVELLEINLDLQSENTLCIGSADGNIELTVDGGVGDITYQWNNGAGNSEDPQNLPAGIYTVTVTDSLTCFAVDSIEIGSPDPMDIAASEIGMVDCSNEYEGFINIEVLSDADTLMYFWSTGDETQNIANVTAGSYSVTVLDEDGCTTSADFEITANLESPEVQAQSLGVLTCEERFITVSGAGSDVGLQFEYLWTTNDGNIVSDSSLIDITVDEPGEYQLVVTNTENGCTESEVVSVDQLTSPPSGSIAEPDFLSCNTSIINLESSSTSPDSLTTYLWSTANGSILSGNNTSSPAVDQAGTYDLIVTDIITGCTDLVSVEVTENIIIPTSDPGPSVIFTCSQREFELDGSNSLGSDLIFEWTTTTGNIVSGENTAFPEIDQPGDYFLVVTDMINGCSDTSMISAPENITMPSVIIAEPLPLNCMTESVTLDATGSSSGGEYIYTWSSVAGSPISDINSEKPTVSESGMYTLQIENINNNCVQTLDVMVPENYATPVAIAGPSMMLTCTDTVLTLLGDNLATSSNYVYLWTTNTGNIISGSTTLNPEVNQPGTYSLEITDLISGCVDAAQVDITVDSGLPLAIVTNSEVLNCRNSEIQLDGSGSSIGGPFVMEWTTADGNIISGDNTLQPMVDQPGEYTLTIINEDNNCIVSNSIDVLIDTIIPQIDLSNTGEITCDLTSQTIEADINSNSGIYSFVWSTPDGSIISSTSNLDIEVDQGGTYELEVIDEVNGCRNFSSILVPQDTEIPIVSTGPDQVLNCIQSSVDLTGSTTSTGNFFYTWISLDGNTITNPQLPTITVTAPGMYQLFIENVDTGCEDSNMVLVDANYNTPDPALNQPDTLSCHMEIVDLYLSGVPNSSNYGIDWFDPAGSLMSVADPYHLEVTEGGMYTVEVMDLSSGCMGIENVDVPGEPNPISDIEVLMTPPPCYEQFGSIEVTAIEGGFGPYQYSLDGGATFSDDKILNNLIAGSYSVLVSDKFGCEYEQFVEIPDLLEVEVDIIDVVSIDFAEDYTLELDINLPLNQIAQIEWTPEDYLSCTDCPNPIASPFSNMTYHVLVIDQNGCEDEAEIRILVDQNPDIYIPNIFTPFNGDGSNDLFFINSKEGQVNEVLEFLIFDRWGNRVFENFNFQPNEPAEGWNGTYRNQEVNPAVFAYMAKIELIDGRVEIYHGDVTVLD